ncbi:MAG: hypothetical protein N2314_02530 [Brevinematales bacterium]|nr:hypothetical protein [Brevinematales bacterium]
MKRVIVFLILFPWIGFAQMQNPREGRNPMGQRMMREPEPQISLTEVMLFQYLQIHEIQQNYMQKIRQITLLTRTQGEKLRQELATYERRFLDLTSESTLSVQQQEEIMSLLEEISRINQELFALQRKAMKEIETLNLEREKRILSITHAWLKKARKNPEELMNFVHFVQKKRSFLPTPPPNETD